APAAPKRAEAAAQTTRFQLRIPPGEWDTSVLTPPPDYVVLSNLETMHAVNRLHEPAAVRFVQSIPADYRPTSRRSSPSSAIPAIRRARPCTRPATIRAATRRAAITPTCRPADATATATASASPTA